MPELTVFVSHRSSDSKLAQRLVELLEKALKFPARQIRCTSVDGYRLPVGADTDEQLRREVFEARTFIGVITPSSIGSSYVLFELGARWGAKKQLAPVLARGADAASLGGPLAGLNALRLDQRTQVIQLVEDIAEYLALSVEPAASFQDAIDQLVAEASKAVEGAPSTEPERSASVLRPQHKLTDDEIVGIIRDWINTSLAAQSLKPIYFETVDRELGLPPGSAARFIEQAASRWYVVAQKGPNLIVFEDKPREPSPSRRAMLKGF
jgi:hypothetical protein